MSISILSHTSQGGLHEPELNPVSVTEATKSIASPPWGQFNKTFTLVVYKLDAGLYSLYGG